MRLRLGYVALLVLLACGALVGPWQDQGLAQEARGTIVGRVSDATGAVIPGATVDVSNKAMGTTQTSTTNQEGLYQVTYLLPGQYQVSVEAQGFKKHVLESVEVRVGDRLELNVTVEVGASAESVTVTAETPLLDTGTASMGTVVDGRRIAEMPIPHGNPYFLIGLAPGVTFARDPRLDRPHEPTHIVGYAMDGTRANRSDVTIDGLPSTSTANANEVTASYVPPADIIAEFKVQTATFDASFGQTEGGVTNISTKSGTNAIHGAAYYTKMAPSLFANDYFANANRIAKPDFYYDRWGGSAGGPVWLPKVYDGRNKTFFLWGYEGIHEARPRNNGVPTVPTEKMKAGDSSDFLSLPNSANYQVYNPLTRRAVANNRFQADPFPNNIIPQSMFDPVAANILKYFPSPRTAGNADGTNNYLRPEMQEVITYYTHTGRFDQVISDKQRLFVRGSWYRRDAFYNNYFDNLATGTQFQFLSRAAVIDDVYTLNPTTVLNVRYGYNRFVRVDRPNPESIGFDLTSLGFPASYNNAISPDVRSFPRIDFPGSTYQGTAFGSDFRPTDIHAANFALQKSHGTHFLKGGVEFRAYRENSIPTGNDQTGRFSFDSTYTKGPLDNATAPVQLSQSFAAFLLGLPSGANSQLNRAASYSEQSTSWGFFIHDDWKATQKLTLNIGLRWEFEGALTERYNRSVRGFDPAAQQPFEAQAQANYAQKPTPEIPVGQFSTDGGLTFAGVGGLPRGLYDTPKRNLMPRFGITYALNQKTVLRAGYGMFFGFLGQRRGDVIQSGFSRTTPFIATLDNVNFINRLSNPFPSGILEPVGSAQGSQTFVGQPIVAYNTQPEMPYMQRWEFDIQRELPGGYLFDIAYVGNRGTHIEILRDLNTTPYHYLSKSPVRDAAAIQYLSANLTNPMSGLLPAGAISALTGTNIARERLLRPYPQFDTVISGNYDGYSWYHSLQMKFEKRFAKGYTIMANYTYSKFMEATELLNNADPLPTEAISSMDYPHRIVVSAIYELPFGRGRRFLANSNAVARAIAGGWQISGFWGYQSGPAITWGAGNPTNRAFGQTLNPNSVIFNGNIADIGLSSDERTAQRWFNTGAGFERASGNQLDLVRQIRTFPLRIGSLRGDPGNNWDLAVIKNTRIAEGKDVQFKAEFLNALNHPQFPVPSGNGANPANLTFGSISNSSNQANYPRRIQLSLKFLF